MPAFFDHGMLSHEPAWHRMGNVLDHWPGTWDEAAAAAGLNWDVESVPLYVNDAEPGRKTKLKGYYGVQRNDNREILAVNKESRINITNAEFGGFIEYVMGADLGRELKFETLISIRGGRIVAATMYLDEPIEIPGDPSPFKRYLVFYTRHDVGGLRCGPVNIRVVCANTQQAADSEMDRTGASWSIRHTANWAERMNEIRENVQNALRTDEEWLLMAKEMAYARVDAADVTKFIDKWIPLSTDMSSIQVTRAHERRAKFLEIYRESATTEGIRGSKWGLYQTAIEMCDHFRSVRSQDAHVDRVLISGDTKKVQARKILERI